MIKHTLLVQHAAKADDPYFHAVLYNTLVDMRATAQLLQLDSPMLERHLRSSAGLPDRGAPPPGAAIGPLSPTQVPALSVSGRHDISCDYSDHWAPFRACLFQDSMIFSCDYFDHRAPLLHTGACLSQDSMTFACDCFDYRAPLPRAVKLYASPSETLCLNSMQRSCL